MTHPEPQSERAQQNTDGKEAQNLINAEALKHRNQNAGQRKKNQRLA
jgi:hypothetical protein